MLFKKFSKLCLFILMSILMLTACTISSGNSEKIETIPNVEDFILVDDACDYERYIETYRLEVTSRLENNSENYLTDAEKDLLEGKGYTILDGRPKIVYYDESIGEITTYMYPVLFSVKSGEIYLWSTTNNGELAISLISKKEESKENISAKGWLEGTSSNVYVKQNVHYSHNENCEIYLESYSSYAIVYDKLNNVIIFSRFGEVFDESKLPIGTEYKGHNDALEHLFLQANDVYSVWCSKYDGVETEVIAHNVQDVVATKYSNDVSEINEPIFKMLDGSYKVYRRPYSSFEAADSSVYLIELGE